MKDLTDSQSNTGQYLFNVVLRQSFGSNVNRVLLHLLVHVSILDDSFSLFSAHHGRTLRLIEGYTATKGFCWNVVVNAGLRESKEWLGSKVGGEVNVFLVFDVLEYLHRGRAVNTDNTTSLRASEHA